ncbi:MAG: dihydroorotate dehydrogenase electron transfer subunit [Streptosporangiales bacterium]|nr:dihydroorotate dehydrogenase electron transfer subunit [Streptosporangiales bacterium]
MSVPPRQVPAEVLQLGSAGAYLSLRLRAPELAAFQPGQFAAVAVGGRHTGMVLRRCFSLYAGDPGDGTVEVVFAVHGKGTAWLAELRPGDQVDVVGPLGRPFPLPARPGAAVLVGGGYGSAPLFSLADVLHAAGGEAHLVVGAASADKLFFGEEAWQRCASVTVTTDDGSAGVRGLVTDPLPELIARTGATVLYACGPMAMLAACTAVAREQGITAYTAVEEAMACGVGVCMTCVLPVVGDDGVTRMTRSCTAGPVFAGETVRWADVGTVPTGTWGAGGH